MVEDGPWAPIEENEEEEEEEPETGRGFWDYAAIVIAIVLVIAVGIFVASSLSSGEEWALAIHTEHGEYDQATVVLENETVVFDAVVGFAGDPNGDVVENVQVRAIGAEGQTIWTRCYGTLTNDADNELQQVQFHHDRAPERVIIEATAVHNTTSTFRIQGWQWDTGFTSQGGSIDQEQSSYINESACQGRTAE